MNYIIVSISSQKALDRVKKLTDLQLKFRITPLLKNNFKFRWKRIQNTLGHLGVNIDLVMEFAFVQTSIFFWNENADYKQRCFILCCFYSALFP